MSGDAGDADSACGSTRPYLIRAIYDWALDQGLTPQVMVNVELAEVTIPKNYSKDGKIVLNLHPSSVRGLEMSDEHILFSARFAGRAEDITIPMDAVMAVYSRENGQGIVFQADGSGVTPPPLKTGKVRNKSAPSGNLHSVSGSSRSGSHLKVVK